MVGVPSPAVKPFWLGCEALPKQSRPSLRFDQTTGCDHGCLPQRDLSRSPQGLYSRDDGLGGEVVTDVVTALLVFLSLSVFVAHAFDAYRAS